MVKKGEARLGWHKRPEWEEEMLRELPGGARRDVAEEEWLVCADEPSWMFQPLARAQNHRTEGEARPQADRSPSCREWRERKAWLLTCAAVSRVWHLLPGGPGRYCRDVIETLGRCAEGEASAADLKNVHHRLLSTVWAEGDMWGSYAIPWAFAARAAAEAYPEPSEAAVYAVLYAMEAIVWAAEAETYRECGTGRALWRVVTAAHAEVAAPGPWDNVSVENAGSVRMSADLCDLVRDIFGNPFRPVAFNPEWRTRDALLLARQMYDSRDFGAMPILADALQDAGCDSEDILDHCRGDGPHVRGCWVVDLVLGKT